MSHSTLTPSRAKHSIWHTYCIQFPLWQEAAWAASVQQGWSTLLSQLPPTSTVQNGSWASALSDHWIITAATKNVTEHRRIVYCKDSVSNWVDLLRFHQVNAWESLVRMPYILFTQSGQNYSAANGTSMDKGTLRNNGCQDIALRFFKPYAHATMLCRCHYSELTVRR